MVDSWIGKFVLVRTYSAGVHAGVLRALDGKCAVLTEARNIWSWKGRNTLYEIATRGVGAGSRLTEVCAEVLLTEVIQILPVTAEAEASLRSAGWSS